MKRWWAVGLMFVLLCGVGGCKSAHEAVAADSIALMNELCDVMEGVTDDASAQAAVPKIENLGARMKELVDRFNAAGTPDQAEAQRLMEKYKPQQEKLASRMGIIHEKVKKYPVLSQAFAKHFSGTLNLKFVPQGGARFDDVFGPTRPGGPRR